MCPLQNNNVKPSMNKIKINIIPIHNLASSVTYFIKCNRTILIFSKNAGKAFQTTTRR